MYRDSYLETEILSASPMRLVELLYRGAIEAVRQARNAVDGSNIAERNRQIARAHAILSELLSSLDHGRGGALSLELAELYDYMQRRLNDANFEQTTGPIEEVRRLLETLLDAWTTISATLDLDALASHQGASQFGAIDREVIRVDQRG